METWDQERYKRFYEDYPMDIVGIENISLADLEDRYRQHLKQYKYWKNKEFRPWGIISEEKELVRVYKKEIKRRLTLKQEDE